MNHLSRVGVFVAVAKAGSFAGAAKVLGLTSSAVSKQVQNLEQALQVKLLNRTTRRVSVTEEGEVYYQRAKRALEDLQEAQEEIYELKARPKGSLKVSLPISLGAKYLSEAIATFAANYPEVELNVSLDDRFVDIVGEGYDVTLRIGALEDSSLIARRIASCPFVMCASPGYLKANGAPEKPEDLTNHNVLAFTQNNVQHQWRYKDEAGQIGQVQLTGNFKSDSGDIMCRAAIEGVGITILPIFYAAEPIEEQKLRPLLPEYVTWPERDIYAVFQPNRFQSVRQRLLVDHLMATCKQLPWEKST